MIVWMAAAVGIMAAGWNPFRHRGNGVMSAKEFMAYVRACVERDYPHVRLLKENGLGWDYRIEGKDGPQVIFLDNLYELYKSQPKDVDMAVSRFLKIFDQSNESLNEWTAVKDRLLPMVKSREFANAMPVPTAAIAFPDRPELVVLIAIDSPDSVAYAPPESVKKWGLSSGALMEIMLHNLGSKTHNVGILRDGDKKMFSCCDGDGYDASRILLPSLANNAKSELGCNRVAVIIPHRDLLLAGSADSPEVVKGLKRIAESEYKANPYRITPEVILLPNE